VYDSARKRHYVATLFLPLISADTPARNKLGGFLGVAGSVACYHCTFEGHKYADAEKGGMYFCGYAHESPQLITRADGKTVHAWDPSLRKPDAAHRLFCEKVHGELHTLPKTLGDCFGFWGCALWKSLKISLLKLNASWRGDLVDYRVSLANLAESETSKLAITGLKSGGSVSGHGK
jgi:hypothetical protein